MKKINTERIRVGHRVVIQARGKKKIYTAEFHYQGKHRRKSLRTTIKKEAIRSAVELEHELNNGNYRTDASQVRRHSKTMTIAEVVSNFLKFGETEGLRRRTLTKQKGILHQFMDFAHANNIDEITDVDLTFIDKYRSFRKPNLSPKSMHHEGALVKQVLTWCCERGLIPTNPLAARKFTPPKYAPRGGPSLEQIVAILAAASAVRHPVFATLAYTGLRSGEVAGLRGEDIDFVGNWIHVVSRPGFETKSGNSWKLPIHPRLRKILEDVSHAKTGFFFTALPSKQYPAGNHAVSTKHLNEDFLKILRALEIPAGRNVGFTVHSLRHAFKAICINTGVPREVVDVWQDHAPDRAVSNLYYKLADEESQRFMRLVPF